MPVACPTALRRHTSAGARLPLKGTTVRAISAFYSLSPAQGAAESCTVLSFAQITSAAMSLRCNVFVTVMKTAELRDCDDPADTRDLPREGTLLVQPQMVREPWK